MLALTIVVLLRRQTAKHLQHVRGVVIKGRCRARCETLQSRVSSELIESAIDAIIEIRSKEDILSEILNQQGSIKGKFPTIFTNLIYLEKGLNKKDSRKIIRRRSETVIKQKHVNRMKTLNRNWENSLRWLSGLGNEEDISEKSDRRKKKENKKRKSEGCMSSCREDLIRESSNDLPYVLFLVVSWLIGCNVVDVIILYSSNALLRSLLALLIATVSILGLYSGRLLSKSSSTKEFPDWLEEGITNSEKKTTKKKVKQTRIKKEVSKKPTPVSVKEKSAEKEIVFKDVVVVVDKKNCAEAVEESSFFSSPLTLETASSLTIEMPSPLTLETEVSLNTERCSQVAPEPYKRQQNETTLNNYSLQYLSKPFSDNSYITVPTDKQREEASRLLREYQKQQIEKLINKRKCVHSFQPKVLDSFNHNFPEATADDSSDYPFAHDLLLSNMLDDEEEVYSNTTSQPTLTNSSTLESICSSSTSNFGPLWGTRPWVHPPPISRNISLRSDKKPEREYEIWSQSSFTMAIPTA